ncbi:MAG: hypothetical protein Q8K45_04730 [Rubrivivax sp.]|nr:hypothetical protein [Rubrivivax sp.]
MPQPPTAWALLLAALLPLAASAQAPGGRVMPPPGGACPPDHLTLYAGSVLKYSRRPGQTEVQIRTDWQTTESVRLKHPGSDDPSRWFLIDRQPFTAADWPRIELKAGQLRPDMRVAAWVCDDGRNATLDWAPPRAP